MSKEIEITSANFDAEVLKSAVPVLLDFWATWCGPCRMIAPSLEQISDEYDGKLKVGKVNVDEEQDLAGKHGITSIPTMVLYKNGQIAAQKTGALPKPAIEAFFREYL